jgi:hypothetical protein
MARKIVALKSWDSAPRNPIKRISFGKRQVDALLARRNSVGADYESVEGVYMPTGEAVAANRNIFEDTVRAKVWEFLGLEEDPLPGINRKRTFA